MSKSKNTDKNLEDRVKEILANQLGIEADDISCEDSFTQELHMSPADLTDFVENLAKEGFETKEIDITNVNNLNDLIDILSSQEAIY